MAKKRKEESKPSALATMRGLLKKMKTEDLEPVPLDFDTVHPARSTGITTIDFVCGGPFNADGVNACMGDGSVRFVKNTVTQSIWWALGTRANNEVFSADQY